MPDRRSAGGRRRPAAEDHRVGSSRPSVLRKTAGVPPRGFEPLISTLKGWRPRPLDDEGSERRRVYQRVPRRLAAGAFGRRGLTDARPLQTRLRRARQDPENDRRCKATGGDEERDPADQRVTEGSAVAPVNARSPGGDQADDRERSEDEPENCRTGGQQRDLRRVANRDRVGEIEDRADEGDHEHDAGRGDREGSDPGPARRRPGVAWRRPDIARAA